MLCAVSDCPAARPENGPKPKLVNALEPDTEKLPDNRSARPGAAFRTPSVTDPNEVP